MSKYHFSAPKLALMIGLFGSAIASNLYAQTRYEFILGANVAITNNFYYQEQQELTNNWGTLKGRINAERQSALIDTRLSVFADGTAHGNGSQDNYSDFGTEGDAQFKLGWNTFSIDGSFRRDHDAFGTIRTEGSSSFDRDLDIYDLSTVALSWKRNGEQKGSFFTALNAKYNNYDYVTNKSSTQFLDRDSFSLSGSVGYHVSRKTGIYLLAVHGEVDFEQDTTSVIRSGTNDAFLVGIRWQSSSKTSGDFQFGQAERRQDVTDAETNSTYWKARLQWTPRGNSNFTLESSRRYEDSYVGDAEYFDTKANSLIWEHNWTPRFNSTLELTYTERDFIRSIDSDKTGLASIRLSYALDRSFAVFAYTRYRDRESTRIDRDYQRSIGMLGFQVKLN
ncbi:MAG: outer membrane beta-barrel protein [Oceanococcus sp.]